MGAKDSLYHIIVSDISLVIALGYISVAENLGIFSTTFTQCTRKLLNSGKWRKIKGHYRYAVQVHSRSPILVLI